MFPTFSKISEILCNKTYKDVPLPEIAISSKRLRSHSSAKFQNDVAFLDSRLMAYEGYISKLIFYLNERFEGETFNICKNIGKLFNFHSALYPCTGLNAEMNPFVIASSEDLLGILEKLPFYDKLNTKTLHPEYQLFLKYVQSKLSQLFYNPVSYTDVQAGTIYLLKTFVYENNHECFDLLRLMSLCVCFPVSEAIVESWGSTITHLFSLKHNAKENKNDLAETGSIDKLTFIKLNGPPPGMRKNRDLLKRALNSHFKCDYARHFMNTTDFKQSATSKVVSRIIDPSVDKILPCFT